MITSDLQLVASSKDTNNKPESIVWNILQRLGYTVCQDMCQIRNAVEIMAKTRSCISQSTVTKLKIKNLRFAEENTKGVSGGMMD